jgi:L-asparaginase
MLILNSGGTFNKRYNAFSGNLEVPYDNKAVERILESTYNSYQVAGVVYKDSLEMDSDDRKMIANIIMESKEDTFVIVHGTDTIHITAEFLDEVFDDRIIIMTGAMKPFEIDSVESSLNLGMAIGFANGVKEPGVYICMNGLVQPWNKIVKNRDKGRFEFVG